MLSVAGSFSRVTIGASTGIESAVCIVVTTETLMHRDHGALPIALWCLVDQRVPGGTSAECVLASVELVSLRQRALCLLRRRMLEQRMNLMVGPTILGRCGL